MTYLNDRDRFGPTTDKGTMKVGNVQVGGNVQCAKVAPNYGDVNVIERCDSGNCKCKSPSCKSSTKR